MGYQYGQSKRSGIGIDTGILPNHEDIAGSPNLISGYDMISDTSRANDGSGRDNDPTDPGDAMAQGECGFGQPPQPQPNSWHGSHVAGTIGAGKTDNDLGVAGINWNVKVQAVRVLGKCGARRRISTTASVGPQVSVCRVLQPIQHRLRSSI